MITRGFGLDFTANMSAVMPSADLALMAVPYSYMNVKTSGS